ncbi:hypothetical protein [Paraburkholderia azotifigens]|uniref:Uncharacterized protein n=1 Tax=Paraburkholderia azotifigens TaxID=2057004 RepID=A0A5C6V1P8_9BURK|nr:hypothetical protein [Paraburkholderia azotifigens]TXC79119.1 hypothetical protein FRZ40_32385 [Paraburkholderia azotifigens]
MTKENADLLLKDALLAATSHLALLDDSISTGIYRAPTNLLMWILRKQNPRLTFQIYKEGLADKLITLLDEYTKLREFSTQFVDRDEYDPYCWNIPEHRVQFEHLEYALTESDAPVSQEFRDIFAKAALNIAQRPDIDGRLNRAERALRHEFRRPVKPLWFDHEWATRAPRFEMAAPPTDNVEAAVNWAFRHLTRMDNGREDHFWQTVDINVVTEWLQQDKPDLVRALHAEDRIDEFHVAATRLLESYIRIQVVWAALGYYVRGQITMHSDRALAIRIIKLMMSTMPDDMVHGVSAEDVYAMFSCRLRPSHPNETQAVYETDWSSAAISRLRADAPSGNTLFLIDRMELPKSLWHLSGERHCLAVRLPEDWRQHRDWLAKDDGPCPFFSRRQNDETRSHLKVNGSFWMPYDDAMLALAQFRSDLPVAYVFEKVVILVVYRFNRFTDFASMTRSHPRYRDCYKLNDGDWTYAAESQTLSRPDGSQLKPTIFDTIEFGLSINRTAATR